MSLPELDLAKTVASLVEDFVQKTRDDAKRAIAVETGGLPVYADLDGYIVLLPTGVFILYTLETGDSAVVTDDRWRTLAKVAAAESFPELAILRPARPAEAVSCPSCGGRGRLRLASLRCGVCWGTGWTLP